MTFGSMWAGMQEKEALRKELEGLGYDVEDSERPETRVMQHYRGYILCATDNPSYTQTSNIFGPHSYKGYFLSDPVLGAIPPVSSMPKIVVLQLFFAQEKLEPFTEVSPIKGELAKREFQKAENIYKSKKPTLQDWGFVYQVLCEQLGQRGVKSIPDEQAPNKSPKEFRWPNYVKTFEPERAAKSFLAGDSATLNFKIHPLYAQCVSDFARDLHDRFGVDGCQRPKPEVFCRNVVAGIYMGCGD